MPGTVARGLCTHIVDLTRVGDGENQIRLASTNRGTQFDLSARESGLGLRFGEVIQLGESMLWTLLVILLILWALGFIGGIGSLIHFLLVVALIVLVLQLVTGGRRAV